MKRLKNRWLIAAAALGAVVLVAATASAGGKSLSTTLSGAEETAPADPDGSGTADLVLNQGRGQICWDLTWQNIEPPTASHIHKAPAGVAGPIAVNLFTSPPGGSAASGCTEGVAKSLVKDIRKNPTQYYVNIHNGSFPGGAIRGQLGD